MNLNRQIPTVFLPQAIAPKGKRAAELNPLELGLIDCETNKTVDAAEYRTDRKYQFVFKTGSKGMDNAMFPDQRGAQLPVRVDVGHVTRAHVFEGASSPALPFVAYWGYDGISDCKTISLECAQDYGLQITVRGESVRNSLNRNFTEIVPFHTACCEDCDADSACDATVDSILKAIKTSTFYVDNYFEAEKVKSCCPVESPFPKKDYAKFDLDVCDNGSTADLAKVQRQYPDFKVERVKRDAPTSTYEICIAAPNTAADQAIIDPLEAALEAAIAADPQVPADITAAQDALDAANATARTNAKAAVKPADYVAGNVKPLVCDECPDCPTGYTKVDAGFKYIVQALNFDGSVDFDTATDAEKEAYIVTLGFPGYVVDSGVVLGCDGDVVTVQLCSTTEGATAPADTKIDAIGACAGKCEGSSTYVWCVGDDLYKISRTQCITIKKDDCEEGVAVTVTSPLALEVLAQLELDDSVETDTFAVESDGDCLVKFTVDQCNDRCLEDGCDTFGKDGAVFTKLIPFGGQVWDMCDCEGWTVNAEGCPVAPVVDTESCLCGIKFTGALVNPETGLPCIYDIGDNIEREPIEIEVTLIRQYQDESFANCEEHIFPDWTIVQYGKVAEGLGQFVARQEVLSREYDLYMYFNPKEALGKLFQTKLGYEYEFDPNRRYNHISLYLNRDFARTYHKHDAAERHLIKIFVDSQNVTLLEELKAFLNKTLLKHGPMDLI